MVDGRSDKKKRVDGLLEEMERRLPEREVGRDVLRMTDRQVQELRRATNETANPDERLRSLLARVVRSRE